MYRDRYLLPDDYCEDTGYDGGAIEVESEILQYGPVEAGPLRKISREPEAAVAAAKAPEAPSPKAPVESVETPEAVEQKPVRRRTTKHTAPKPAERKKAAARKRPAARKTTAKKASPAKKSTSARTTRRATAAGGRSAKRRTR